MKCGVFIKGARMADINKNYSKEFFFIFFHSACRFIETARIITAMTPEAVPSITITYCTEHMIEKDFKIALSAGHHKETPRPEKVLRPGIEPSKFKANADGLPTRLPPHMLPDNQRITDKD